MTGQTLDFHNLSVNPLQEGIHGDYVTGHLIIDSIHFFTQNMTAQVNFKHLDVCVR